MAPRAFIPRGAIALLLVVTFPIDYNGPPGPYSQWFKSQMQEPPNQTISCCGDEEHFGGDGRYVDVRSVGGYWEVFVREKNEWVLYPYPVNPEHSNPTGQNVAWYRIDEDSIIWYCLRLSGGT